MSQHRPYYRAGLCDRMNLMAAMATELFRRRPKQDNKSLAGVPMLDAGYCIDAPVEIPSGCQCAYTDINDDTSLIVRPN